MHIELGKKSSKTYYDSNLERVNKRSLKAHIRIQ